MMRRFLRVIWLIVLSISLLVAVVLFTLRWWVTSAINAALPPLLAEAPVEEASLEIRELGLAATQIDIQQVKAAGFALTDTQIEVDYAVEQLQRQSVDTVSIRHPHLQVDLGALLGQEADADDSEPSAFTLPQTFPLNQLKLTDAEITLLKDDWRQQLTASADVYLGQRSRFKLQLADEVSPLDATGVINLDTRSGAVRASWSLDSVTHWLEQAPALGFALPAPLDELTLSGDVLLDAAIGAERPKPMRASLQVSPLNASLAGGELQADFVEASIRGRLGESLLARLALPPATLTWGDGAGRIEGLRGELDPVSLIPLGVFTPQTLSFDHFSQGELSANEGRLTFTYQPDGTPELDVNLETTALDGSITIHFVGSPFAPRSLEVTVRFNRVDLEDLAALMPDFDGRIIGTVSGELGLKVGEEIDSLLPGYLEMTPGTTGRFQFYKQGWVTQDPNLNPVEFAKDKDILSLLKEPNGATVLTELAMRDLQMSKFRLDVTETKRGAPAKVTIALEGEGEVKGTVVPVVLDVPVTGDVIETLNLVLKIQQRM